MPRSWIDACEAATGRKCVLAAPLAEISDGAFRALALEYGADGATTEMVSAAGLARGSQASLALLARLPSEHGWCSAQLYGHEAAELAQAAKTAAALGAFDAIDLNAGCPMRRIVSNGDGAALMADIGLFGKCIESIVRAVSPLPVTVKTRIGLDPSHPAAAALAHTAESAGAAALVIHGRFANNFHNGPVDREAIAEAVAAVRIPVIANGGVKSAADALELAMATGAAGVMVGRGAVGNPWIFGEIRDAFAGGASTDRSEPVDRSNETVFELFRRHVELIFEAKRLSRTLQQTVTTSQSIDAAVLADIRRHLMNYFKGRPGATSLRRAATAAQTVSDIFRALHQAGYGSFESDASRSASVGI